MPDEPTPWELARNYQELRTDMRDRFDKLNARQAAEFDKVNARLDKLPSSELVTAFITNLERRVQEAEADVGRLEQDIKAERQARAADRRIVIAAALAGVVSVIVTLISPLLTGGS